MATRKASSRINIKESLANVTAQTAAPLDQDSLSKTFSNELQKRDAQIQELLQRLETLESSIAVLNADRIRDTEDTRADIEELIHLIPSIIEPCKQDISVLTGRIDLLESSQSIRLVQAPNKSAEKSRSK